MKKYTILDAKGKKTIVYAKDIAHALPYAKDSRKIKDRMSLSEIDEAIDDIADKYDGFYSRTYDKVFKDLKAKYPNLTYEEVKQVIEKYADNPSSTRAQLRVAKKYFSDSIDDSNVKDSKFYSEEDATEAKKKAAKYGLQVKIGKKVSNGPNKGFDEIYYIGPKDKLTKMLNAEGFDDDEISEMIEDSIKDTDTNIVAKLISEEEKAVMDYKEALMADSDLSANAVYAHILAEELEHLRELRSLREQPSLGDSIDDAELKESNSVYYKFERGYWHILSIHNAKEIDHKKVAELARSNRVIIEPYFRNDYHRTDTGGYYTDYKAKSKDKEGIIKFCETLNPIVKPLTLTDKKLDDSIHDGLSEAKKLVEQAGFKVVRVYGTDNEPYITVDWSGSYSELRKKVSELKSKAKAIGYNDVYADDDDICFSKY